MKIQRTANHQVFSDNKVVKKKIPVADSVDFNRDIPDQLPVDFNDLLNNSIKLFLIVVPFF